MPKNKYVEPEVRPNIVKRYRSISLEGDNFKFTDLRQLMSEAVADGYDEDASICMYSSNYGGNNMLTISENK